jgi:transposase-like protein
VIAGLRGEDSIAELCCQEAINQNLYYRWSKDFLEAGKKRLAGDSAREATSDEVKGRRAETHQLKELLAELMMENRVLKKSVLGDVVGGRNRLVTNTRRFAAIEVSPPAGLIDGSATRERHRHCHGPR